MIVKDLRPKGHLEDETTIVNRLSGPPIHTVFKVSMLKLYNLSVEFFCSTIHSRTPCIFSELIHRCLKDTELPPIFSISLPP